MGTGVGNAQADLAASSVYAVLLEVEVQWLTGRTGSHGRARLLWLQGGDAPLAFFPDRG